jgi:acetyl-CoA carboxylase/biotin carboxylase 1
MKLSPESRHLEVQLLADEYNNAITLYSRDCSIQRRNQKIIEEGPVTVAPEKVLREMEKASINLAKAVNYINVGTLEYLYRDGKFIFLELNPRLQVEHPVTEWITGVNIPACQLNVAMGIPLDRIPDIRVFCNEKPYGTSKINFDKVKRRDPLGHVIAVRITAENTSKGFQPTSGKITELNLRDNTNVWGYFSIRSNSSIHNFSDSQFGHVFAFGKNREEARITMISALSGIIKYKYRNIN